MWTNIGKSWIALIVLSFVSSHLFAQDPPKVENIERKNAAGTVIEKYKTVDGTKEGPYSAFHDDGSKKSVGTYLHGNRTGAWVDYYANGKKSLEVTFEADSWTGAAVRYHDNGKVWQEGTFERGYAKGLLSEYHKNGQLYSAGVVSSSSHNWFSDPVRQGRHAWYYNDGTIHQVADFDNNNWNGATARYHPNGNKQYECNFESGYAKGPFRQYHENGQLYAEGEVSSSSHNWYGDAVQQGEWKYYYSTGSIHQIVAFQNGDWNGLAVRYHENGNKMYECSFEAGYAKGPFKQYHENGQLYAEGEVSSSSRNWYGDVVRQGEWNYYYSDGVTSWTGSYKDSNWEGEVISYHQSGKKSFQATFENGYASGTWTHYHDNGQVYGVGDVTGSNLNHFGGPLKTGVWVNYYADGTRSFEGNYVNNVLDGGAAWFHSNSQQAISSEWVEGTMKGSWTTWHPNGNKGGHGYSYGGSAYNPLKHGPWVWYHLNGNKKSEGKYDHNKATGPWIEYDSNGRVEKIVNYANGVALKGNSEAELPDGSRVIRTSNPDGSSDTYTVDKDGNIVDHEHKPAPGEDKPYIEYEDPDTGETVTVTHDEDGNPKTTKSKTTKDDDGTEHTHEEDDDGTVREITKKPNGEREYREVRPDGTVRESSQDADGNIRRKQTNPDGTVTEYTKDADGRKTRTRRDSEGNIIEEAERTPVGVETVRTPDGTTTRRHKDDEGNWVETTERPDGTISRVVRDGEGNVISRDEKYGERALGQSLYEDVEGGRNWNDLTPEEKKSYADNETKMKEGGTLDSARTRAADGQMKNRDSARASGDKALSDAASDLKREPVADGAAKPPKRTVDKAKLGTAAKALELALRMSDVPFESIQESLKQAIDSKDADKIAELLDQDKNSLPGWLERNADVAQKWTQAVKSGGSAFAAALAVSKGVDHLFKKEYGAALEEFAGASASALGAIPPGTMAQIERELGRNPASQALALKSAIAFGRELSRKLKPGESRNYGTLLKEGVGFMVNGWKSMPEDQRKHFVERNIPAMNKWLESLDKGIGKSSVKRSAGLLALVDAAPHVYKLMSEWGGPNDAANITTLAQKVGPKAIGMLVQASTRSETAGAAAEMIAQLGADYMAHLGNDARKAAIGALRQTEQNAAAYDRMRDAMKGLAVQAGMSHRDAEQYDTVSNLVSGHRGRLVLSDMRRKKDLLGVHESMQAWRRVDDDLGKGSGNVTAFYEALADSKSRSSADEAAYQRWKSNNVNNARRTSEHITSIISEYKVGSPAHKFLLAWQHDLDHMVRTFG